MGQHKTNLKAQLANEYLRDLYGYKGYDPRKTLMLYYDEDVNIFFEPDHCGGLDPIYNIHKILEPWKVFLFKTQGKSIFTDRTNSFLVELSWIPF